MRLKKGSKVEVMNEEVPASWLAAEIISGKGHVFNVRYDGFQSVKKLSRGDIRPYPPAITSQSWVIGDVVEVFDDNLWKTATVLKVLKGGRYLVRPHEFTHEIRAHKTSIRARLSWRDDQWVHVEKVSRTNDARLKKKKRAYPFGPSHLNTKKFKLAEIDGSQSQRHSFEKSDNWRHACFASKGSKQDCDSQWDISAHPFATDKIVCCHLALI